jgi:signal transduction histidine kinase
MRGFSLAILMVIAVATVLGFSLRSLQKEKDRLRQGFVGAQETNVRELAFDFEDRLRDLQENARVIETLVKKTQETPRADQADQMRSLHASFNAMATVIRHYRTLTLLGPNRETIMVAVDPTENQAAAKILTEMSREVPAIHGGPRLTGPIEPPDKRSFYFYSFPVGLDTVVISVEGSVFLQSAFRSLSDSRILVSDPQGTEWVGLGPASRFVVRAPELRSEEERRWTEASGSAWVGAPTGQALGLPVGPAVAVWTPTNPSEFGVWKIILVRVGRSLSARERALEKQLSLTAVGLLVAIGLVGTLIVRQQRYSAALAERLRSAEALQSLERQLISAEKLATTGVLAAGIAHEVGTPLGIIRARAELLMDETADSNSRRALEAITQQIDRISSTIRQVLDFSRVQPVELRSIDVLTAVQVALELLGHRVRQQQLVVELSVDPSTPPIAADPNQLQQVLLNLLLNACDACQVGGTIEIVARPAADARRVCWEIRDDGIGVPPEHLLAVFDPFFTTKKRGEGTGLGLPIAASIVRNHGGDISLASVPGEETVVTMFWPMAGGEADE